MGLTLYSPYLHAYNNTNFIESQLTYQYVLVGGNLPYIEFHADVTLDPLMPRAGAPTTAQVILVLLPI